MLEHALLDLFQAVMVAVEYAARVLHVKVVLAHFGEWKIEHALYESAHRWHFVAPRGKCRKALYFPGNTLADFFGKDLVLQPFAEFVGLVLLALAELLADGLDLLAEEVFALILFDGGVNVVVYLDHQLGELRLPVHHLQKVQAPCGLILLHEEVDPVLVMLHHDVRHTVNVADIVRYEFDRVYNVLDRRAPVAEREILELAGDHAP